MGVTPRVSRDAWAPKTKRGSGLAASCSAQRCAMDLSMVMGLPLLEFLDVVAGCRACAASSALRLRGRELDFQVWLLQRLQSLRESWIVTRRVPAELEVLPPVEVISLMGRTDDYPTRLLLAHASSGDALFSAHSRRPVSAWCLKTSQLRLLSGEYVLGDSFVNGSPVWYCEAGGQYLLRDASDKCWLIADRPDHPEDSFYSHALAMVATQEPPFTIGIWEVLDNVVLAGDTHYFWSECSNLCFVCGGCASGGAEDLARVNEPPPCEHGT